MRSRQPLFGNYTDRIPKALVGKFRK